MTLPEIARQNWDRDAAPRGLGVELLEVTDGGARMALTVAPVHANSLGICHGGVLFLLADAACGFASNSHGVLHVTSSGGIEYLAPAMMGTRLVATAETVSRSGRSRIVDCRITDPEGRVIALLRSRMRVAPPAAVKS